MPLIIAVANLKGGTGKSTITLALATTLQKAGQRVLIIDADKQGTCRQWAVRAAETGNQGPPVVGLDARALARDLIGLGDSYDVVVIDTPGRLGAEARAAMMQAHLVLLPVAPRPADIWALQETLEVVEEAQSLRPDLKILVVLNRVNRTVLSKVGTAALNELGVPIAEVSVGDRIAHGEAMLAGLGVGDLENATTARSEIDGLTRAVLGVVS